MNVRWRIRRKEFSLEKFEMLAAMLNIKPTRCVLEEFKDDSSDQWVWLLYDGEGFDLANINYTYLDKFKELTIEEIINVHFNPE